MEIYFYDAKTFEYIGKKEADKDPEETKIQGKFIPLVPANATLVRPMATLKNKIQVFNKNLGIWELYDDFRENFSKVDKFLNVLDITEIGSIDENFILISKDLGEKIKENQNYFKINNGKIAKKTQEEIQQEEQEKETKRISNLSLTKREVLLSLFDDKGITPEQIKNMLDTRGQIEFEYAASYLRGNPLIDSLGTALGYTKEQLDYLFEHKKFEVV